jgi:hypothetical protein
MQLFASINQLKLRINAGYTSRYFMAQYVTPALFQIITRIVQQWVEKSLGRLGIKCEPNWQSTNPVAQSV